MSKLPIGAFHQEPGLKSEAVVAATTAVHMNQVMSNFMKNNTTSTVAVDHVSGTSICVDGILLWLLLIWITTGTASMLVLLIRCCRSRWKNMGDDQFDWGGLETIRPHEPYSRSTTSSSLHAVPTVVPSVPPPAPPLPTQMNCGHRASAHFPAGKQGSCDPVDAFCCARRMDSAQLERRHTQRKPQHRSRRLQCTQA